MTLCFAGRCVWTFWRSRLTLWSRWAGSAPVPRWPTWTWTTCFSIWKKITGLPARKRLSLIHIFRIVWSQQDAFRAWKTGPRWSTLFRTRSIVPVSYTHLDVYKRQSWSTSSLLEALVKVWPIPHCVLLTLATWPAVWLTFLRKSSSCLLYTSRCV